jgi:hypothetical protein
MRHQWGPVYQPPTSPLARIALAVVGVGVLALSFMLGLFVLAIALGVAVLWATLVALRLAWLRWFGGTMRGDARDDADSLQVEYRVVRRESRRDDD